MKLEYIKFIAEDLLEQLSSACTRIEIKGSIIRCKPEPNDIEIVCIPSTGVYVVRDMFDQVVAEHPINHLEDAVITLIAAGAWEFDTEVKRNGAKYKRLRHIETGVCCDLFITDARRWGIIATIRTGPGDFSKTLVKMAHPKRMFINDGLLHNHAPVYDENGDVKPCPSGERCGFIIPTPEEANVFKALGLRWLEPSKRTVNMLYAVRADEAVGMMIDD